MRHSKLVLLFGLDETGAMFAPLLQVIPSDMLAQPAAYPETLERFDEYVEFVVAALHGVTDVVLVAKSF